jgi:hypothetical protein
MRIGLRHKSLILRRVLIVFAVLPALAADLALEIPPVPVSLNIAGQPVAITISGDISASQQSFTLNLRADLADLQSHMTPLLQAELNQSNRCGERVSVEKATLVPAPPAGNLTIQLHFEKWACFKAFGKENAKRLVGGNGTVNVILTPRVADEDADGNTVRLDAEIGNIEADGSLGELLHSEYGATMRDKIREALLKAIQKSAILEAVVPPRARPFVTIQSVAFAEKGTGILLLSLTGRLQVPGEQVSSVLEQFRNRK